MNKNQLPDCFVLPLNPMRKGEGGLRTKGYHRNFAPDKPVITIVSVVLNGAQRISDTIESILNQDYPGIEYIIIDGGSTDGTTDIIKRYESRIDYWVSEPDTGIYDAMNKGWRLANSRSYILYLGAGDKVMSLPDETRFMPPNRVIYGIVHKEDGTLWISKVNWMLKYYNTLHHQALLVPKQLHPLPPFDTTLKVYGDFDFNQRLYKNGAGFVRAPEFVSYFALAGACATFPLDEFVYVIRKNFGPFWAFLRILLQDLKEVKKFVIKLFRL